METYVIAKFHEIALKGKNRPMFIRKLVDNLRQATKGTGVQRVWKGQMMVGLTLSEEAAWPQVRERVENCFGVAKFFRAHPVPPRLERVEELLASVLKDRSFQSFRITANRADKEFPLKSPEINRDLGTFVQQLTSARVDLRQPDLEIFVDVLPREILVYFDEVQGYGGLPVGVSGKVVTLLSGGIDSPVAAWHLMKRGCQVVFVHFHSYPLLDTSSMEKATELAQLLTSFQYRSTLLLVPFTDIQKRIVLSTPAPYRVVLYRRFMLRIGEALARQQRAGALVTGESLGQVSSQTLKNIAIIANIATMPVFRPLIGLNKQEIIQMAQNIGTYPVSILPDQDCCTLFIPRHPVIYSDQETVNRLEALLPVDSMVQEALEQVELKEFAFPEAQD